MPLPVFVYFSLSGFLSSFHYVFVFHFHSFSILFLLLFICLTFFVTPRLSVYYLSNPFFPLFSSLSLLTQRQSLFFWGGGGERRFSKRFSKISQDFDLHHFKNCISKVLVKTDSISQFLFSSLEMKRWWCLGGNGGDKGWRQNWLYFGFTIYRLFVKIHALAKISNLFYFCVFLLGLSLSLSDFSQLKLVLWEQTKSKWLLG